MITISVMILYLQILPPDTLTGVKEIDGKWLEGELIGIESTVTYSACTNCFSKVVEETCTKCNTKPTTHHDAAVMKVLSQTPDGNIETLTLFTAEVQKLSPISPDKEILENDVLQKLPIKINFVASSTKDGSKVVKKLFN